MGVTIGEQIRAARLREGWSQPAFAREVGCSVSQLKKLEAATERPVGSRFLDRIEYLLHLDRAPGDDGHPDDPPVSRATKLQLSRALYRLISAEEHGRRGAGEDHDFDVVGMDLTDDQTVRKPDTRDGDDDASSGVLHT